MTQNDNIPKYCILLSEKHTYLIITSYPVPKLEYRTTICIVVNGEKFQSHAMTLTLIGQCPMPNSSELFFIYHHVLKIQTE